MGRYNYTPESNEELESSLFERDEDVNADSDFEQQREDEFIENEKGLDTKTYLK